MLDQVMPLWRERTGCAIALVLLLAALPLRAQPAHTIGKVAALQGEVMAMTHGQAEPRQLQPGSALFEGDRIKTGSDASVRLFLEDDSIIQLGASSELSLEWVLYAPALDSRNVLLSLPVGIVRLIVEAVVPRSAFELRTPTAVTVADGADWITEAEAGRTAVIAVDGAVTVQNVRPDVVGEVKLYSGEGTLVTPGEPPAEPDRWAEERTRSARERTSLP